MSEKEVVEEYRRFSGTALDMQRLRRRIEAVERRIGLQETQSGIDGRCLEALQDRVTALDSRVTEIADDVYRRLEIRREDAEGVLDRVAAVENDLFLEIARIANEGDRRAELADRVSALEQELEMPRMWARMQERAEQLYRERMDALESRPQDDDPLLRVNRLVTRIVDMESRQQDEAGEESVVSVPLRSRSRPQCVADGDAEASYEAGWKEGRGEMVREIVERLRNRDDGHFMLRGEQTPRSVADWIEREFGGE